MISAIKRFLFSPASARPLAALRIGVALVLLLQVWLLRDSAFDLFSRDGLIQGEIADALRVPFAPRISWLAEALGAYGVSEEACVLGVIWFYVAAVATLLLGFCTRTATIASWLLHWTLMNTGYSTTYGVDLFAHVFLFYLVFAPSGGVWSVDSLLRGRAEEPDWRARLALRVVQLHLCVMYLTSGIEKAKGEQWWDGEVIWRALSLPVYRQYDLSWMAFYPWLPKALCWVTLAVEMGYIIFIWPRATRRLWILAIVGLHLGIIAFLGLGLFGAMMAVLTPAVFAVSAEPADEVARGFLLARMSSRTVAFGR